MQKYLFKNIILVSLFLLTRIINLYTIPPFVDELLYIRWTNTISLTPSQFLLPIYEDGQPPLYFWISGLISRISPLEPLLILRLISILFGALTLALLVKFGHLIHSRRLGDILGYLYIFSPMFLWYDRLAMRESMITFAGTLLLYGLYLRFYHNKIAFGTKLILFALLFGLLTKGTALLFVPVVMIGYLIAYANKRLGRYDYYSIGIILLALILGFIYTKPIFIKSNTFLLDPRAIVSHLYNNIYSTISWLINYSTLPLIIMWLWGVIKLFGKNRLLLFWSLGLFAMTVGIEVISAKIYFPRYFLWVMPLFLLPIGWGILELSYHKIGKLIVLLSIIPVLRYDYFMLFNPLSAPLPTIEQWQYQTGWPSGYGIAELANTIPAYPSDYLVVEKNEACRTGLDYHGATLPPLIDLTDTSLIKTALSKGEKINLCLAKDYPPSNFKTKLLKEIQRPKAESSLRLYTLEDIYE